MKIALISFGVVAILLVAGFAYISLADIPVRTEQVSKTIPNERFFE